MSELFEKIGFGCVGLTLLPTHGHALRLLREAYDGGITHFDTAPLYGQGYSERVLGDFLRTHRDRVTVATKVGLGPLVRSSLPPQLVVPLNYWRRRLSRSAGDSGPAQSGETLLAPRRLTRRDVAASFDASRRALRTEKIDLYLLHEALPAFLDPDALDYLRALKASGQVGRLGLAAGGRNYHALHEAELADWSVLQYEFGPAWPGNQSLPQKFPHLQHNFHSCLNHRARFARPGVAPADLAGVILRDCLAANPNGRVLFFSKNREHVRHNLRVIAGA
jgi:aryl-alcohol dehydrogenase-like predicted oxidoreductase